MQKSGACPQNERGHKRHSDSSSKSKEKRIKLTHDSGTISTVNGDKSTLLGSTLSPISRSSNTSVTKGVQTCGDWTDRQTNRTECITNRLLEDDENTVLIEDFSKHSSHRDAINLSKALQKIIPPRSESPGLSKIKLLFEDESADAKERSSKVNVKTEVPDSGDNDVFIM